MDHVLVLKRHLVEELTYLVTYDVNDNMTRQGRLLEGVGYHFYLLNWQNGSEYNDNEILYYSVTHGECFFAPPFCNNSLTSATFEEVSILKVYTHVH